MGVLLEPFIDSRAIARVHPWELEQHVIQHRVGLSSLGGCTYALHVVAFCKCAEIVVHGALQTSVHAAASAKVMEHAENIWAACEVVGVPFCLARGVREKVESNETVAIAAHCFESTALWHSLPVLDNPFRLLGSIVFCFFHGSHVVVVAVEVCHYVGVAVFVCYTVWQRTLVEGVNAVELRYTHHLFKVLVIYGRECAVALACGLQYVGACVAACPCTVVYDIVSVESVYGVVYYAVGYLSAEAGDYRLHAKLTHAPEHVAAQLLLTGVPPVGVAVHLYIGCIYCSTPTLKVVHGKPSYESGTCNILVYVILAHTQFAQEVACHDIKTNKVQWGIYAVQGHPVNLLLPALPCPESHGI